VFWETVVDHVVALDAECLFDNLGGAFGGVGVDRLFTGGKISRALST
jgi:hypothetical protein